ncbi:hypothetical protein F4808DRAFT_436847 [Astrocystis sublimbata]|nr:hypothetical protein F4808DRAFT_436847 [Astrocystis sublimbata]
MNAVVRARLDLLRAVHPVICPPPPSSRHYLDLPDQKSPVIQDADALLMRDSITLLRSDIKSLPIKLQHAELNRVDQDQSRLVAAFDELLHIFEATLMDNANLSEVQQDVKQSINPFPRLDMLRQLGTQDTMSLMLPLSHAVTNRCRDHLRRLENVLLSVVDDAPSRWNIEVDLEDYTAAEIEAINDAHQFCAASSTLFAQLTASVACQEEHLARLHLSGFQSGLIEMLLCKCKEHTWKPAFFNLAMLSSEDLIYNYRVCSSSTEPDPPSRSISFGLSAVWETIMQSWDSASDQLPRLKDLLLGVTPQPEPSRSNFLRLKKLDRKLIGVFLAWSLFMLYGSPWLQQQWQDDVFILPYPSPNSGIDNRRPLISCTIGDAPGNERQPQAEDVAALGVLILELEANAQVPWTEDDESFETGERSNVVRLARILDDEDWVGELSDGYRQVAKSCLEFEAIVERSSLSGFKPDMKSLAMLYKCVVNPLFQLLVSNFGAAAQAFQNIPALSVPKRQKKRKSSRTKLHLFDDIETSGDDVKVQYAKELLENLEPFLNDIRSLRMGQPGFAETLSNTPSPPRIRVAILDTGVDPTDKMIKGALRSSRIRDCRAFVGSRPTDHSDAYSHGTHVARLILKMAPSAEIFIAKICEGKHLDGDRLSSIAKAIDYAVTEWNVDIISMSFGYYDKNDEIDAAIDRALKADKLLFAAASNEGGNRGRSRPARGSGVICVHACDGKGNKGAMNPSPLKKALNFSALGVAVESKWQGKTVYKSGTSFATPVAAGIAANVLEFAGSRGRLSPGNMKRLKRFEGMCAVLEDMCTERDGYDYLQPQNLFADGKSLDEVGRDIQDVLEGL